MNPKVIPLLHKECARLYDVYLTATTRDEAEKAMEQYEAAMTTLLKHSFYDTQKASKQIEESNRSKRHSTIAVLPTTWPFKTSLN